MANQKEFFGEGFKGDKTFLLIILLAKWVYQLVAIINYAGNLAITVHDKYFQSRTIYLFLNFPLFVAFRTCILVL